jgi:hypothetical protein
MSIPDGVRESIREKVWALADQVGWMALSDSARSKKYEEWTRDQQIGGVLGHYVDPKQVRVYIKDTVIKPYVRARSSDHARPLRVVGIPEDAHMVEVYVKPHGRRLADGKVVCWGNARDWKSILLAVYERAYLADGATPYAAVLMAASGRNADDGFRIMVSDVAERLGIGCVRWLDT